MSDNFELDIEYDFSKSIRGKFYTEKSIDDKWSIEAENRLISYNKGLMENTSLEEVFSKSDK